MDNGIVNLLKRIGTPEDVINYEGFTNKMATLQALMDEQHFNYPANIYSRSMFAVPVQFDLDLASIKHITEQADFYARALVETGWGNIPDVKYFCLFYFGYSLPASYNGRQINPDLADKYFPAQEDIGIKLIVDGMRSFVVRDLEEKATVVRRKIWADHHNCIEMLADEDGRLGLIDRGPSGVGYLMARNLGVEGLIQWEHTYASTNINHASSLSLERFATQIDSLQQ